jgi:hypothetical protein
MERVKYSELFGCTRECKNNETMKKNLYTIVNQLIRLLKINI